MWYSLPVLCFHDCSDGGFFDLRKFNKFVQTCLEKTRKNDLLNVTNTPLTKIEFVLRQPQKISITDVRLWRFHSVSLPSLASMNLERVKLNDETLHKRVLGCRCLKELILDDCDGISRPIISSLSLKLLEAHSEYDEVTFHVEAAKLESFLGTGVAAYFEFGLSSYGTLRELSLFRSRFADWWLEELILKLPILESLTLCDSRYLDAPKIRSLQLKYLSIERIGYSHTLDAKLDCPNLLLFEYEGFLGKNLNHQNLLGAEIKIYGPEECDMNWFINLLEILSSLNCSQYLSLDVSSEKLISLRSIIP
ncbi:LRR domain containing protein [Parasponia andersonii]|uniref:LRR domain containing protein n=1 Tax=Parasponia andersonii TaxID=3476 RepID=A0A2P5A3L6_PARAD|nr:LRR domain containing protein [Parasponia andersonii]